MGSFCTKPLLSFSACFWFACASAASKGSCSSDLSLATSDSAVSAFASVAGCDTVVVSSFVCVSSNFSVVVGAGVSLLTSALSV